jgi:hypothetical protein
MQVSCVKCIYSGHAYGGEKERYRNRLLSACHFGGL